MTSKQLYEAIGQIDDRYLEMVDAPEKENTNRNRKHVTVRKAITYILAAAICISILAVTAMAAGWIPNIFAAVEPVWEGDKIILEEVLQAPQGEQIVEQFSAPELDFTQFTLYERYYDGEKILLGYDKSKIIPGTIVGLQPDEDLLAKIKERPLWQDAAPEGQNTDDLEIMHENGWITEEAYQGVWDHKTENAEKYGLTKHQQFLLDRQLKEDLSPEEYEKFWNILLETGVCCVAIPSDVYISDHIWVNDADCGEVLSPEVGNFRSEYSTDVGDCIILTPLPEAGRNKETVTVKMNLRSGWTYWYIEQEGDVYCYYAPYPAYPVTVTVKNINK